MLSLRQLINSFVVDMVVVRQAVMPARTGSSAGTNSAWKNWRPKIISHTGGMAGVSTALMIVPEHDIAVAVLCNAAHSLTHCVAGKVP